MYQVDLNSKARPAPLKADPICPKCKDTHWVKNAQGEEEWCLCSLHQYLRVYRRPLGNVMKVRRIETIKMPSSPEGHFVWRGGKLHPVEVTYLFYRALLSAGLPKYPAMPEYGRLDVSDLVTRYFDNRSEVPRSHLYLNYDILLLWCSGAETPNKANEDIIIEFMHHHEMHGRAVWTYMFRDYPRVLEFAKERLYPIVSIDDPEELPAESEQPSRTRI
jgi:hypothetical protein